MTTAKRPAKSTAKSGTRTRTAKPSTARPERTNPQRSSAPSRSAKGSARVKQPILRAPKRPKVPLLRVKRRRSLAIKWAWLHARKYLVWVLVIAAALLDPALVFAVLLFGLLVAISSVVLAILAGAIALLSIVRQVSQNPNAFGFVDPRTAQPA